MMTTMAVLSLWAYGGAAGAAAAVAVGLVLLYVWLVRRSSSYDRRTSFEYECAVSGERQPFPSAERVALSVVIPAFNEERRIGPTLQSAVGYLTGREGAGQTWEVIVVDDGSGDATADVVQRFAGGRGLANVRVLRSERNWGKGSAVRRGMLAMNGDYALMADADGATAIADVEALQRRLRMNGSGEGVAVGSRAALRNEETLAQRSALRRLLMAGFHAIVSAIVDVRGIADTQCGFKLFSRNAAKRIFASMHVDRWAFDVEALFKARQMGIPVVEVPVHFEDVAGSKLHVVDATLTMLRDIVVLRLMYALGLWTHCPPGPEKPKRL